jgi:hypothetical protein
LEGDLTESRETEAGWQPFPPSPGPKLHYPSRSDAGERPELGKKAYKSAIQEVVVHVIEIIVTAKIITFRIQNTAWLVRDSLRNVGTMAPQIGVKSVPKCV